MYPQLNEHSYIKIKPDQHLASFIVNGDRTNVVINETASEILQLCNGFYGIEEIAEYICDIHKVSIDIARNNINEFITPLIKIGAIIDKKNDKNISITKGNKDIYYPDHIIWEVTTQCPLRCRHCYLPNKSHKFVSKENINKILEIIHSTGVYSVQLTGGEALLHPETEYIIDSLIAAKIQVALTTSGIILNSFAKKVIKKLRLHGIIRVSIDGDEKYHNEVRQNSNAYEQSINFIKYAIEQKIICQVATVLIDQSLDMINEHVEKMRDLGVSILVLSPVSIQGEAKKGELNQKFDWHNVCELILALNKKYATDSFIIQEPKEVSSRNCGCGYKVIRIRPDMSITPCPMIESSLGSLECSDYDIILSKKSSLFAEHYSPGSTLCYDCDNQKYCGKCTACALQIKDSCQKCTWEAAQRGFIECL